MIASSLFEAEPLVHPNVLEAYEQAIRVLRKARIPYRETGGIALNFYGAGRPTKDVDLSVRRTDWLRAIRALRRIATDQPGIRFGPPGEPASGLAVIGPHGVPIELWPEGTTHGEIARIRGMQKARPHPAGKLAFRVRGDAVVGLVNDKLPSYLSAKDRLRDADKTLAAAARLCRAPGAGSQGRVSARLGKAAHPAGASSESGRESWPGLVPRSLSERIHGWPVLADTVTYGMVSRMICERHLG